jgi:hypothetical protein
MGKVTSIPNDWMISANFSWAEAFINELPSDSVPHFETFQRIFQAGQEFQKVRNLLGVPIKVHCWYRSIEHNVRVYIKEQGFTPAVACTKTRLGIHINGTALDFSVAKMDESSIRGELQEAVELGKIKVRIENGTKGWIHIDTLGEPIFAAARLGQYKYGVFNI